MRVVSAHGAEVWLGASKFAQASPVFWELPQGEPALLQHHLHTPSRCVPGRPMLSLVRSDLCATDLASVLQQSIDIATADGQPFVPRW